MASDNPVPRASNAGSQEPESFEATAQRMFDSALTLYSAEPSLGSREIRADVKSLVAHAKARGLQVERMIIELKQVCQSTESAERQKSEVVARLITMSIGEFYDAERGPLDG